MSSDDTASTTGTAQIGVTGLAVMGSNIARNFARHGYTVALHNRSVAKTDALWNTRIATAKLNRWLTDHVAAHVPPSHAGRRPRLRYMTQPKARPPSFVVFCSRPEAVPDSYVRYMTNGLRERFGLHGVPIRITLRRTDNPYADKG